MSLAVHWHDFLQAWVCTDRPSLSMLFKFTSGSLAVHWGRFRSTFGVAAWQLTAQHAEVSLGVHWRCTGISRGAVLLGKKLPISSLAVHWNVTSGALARFLVGIGLDGPTIFMQAS